MEGTRYAYRLLVGKPRKSDHLEDQGGELKMHLMIAVCEKGD
jgi:hypothetical protein